MTIENICDTLKSALIADMAPYISGLETTDTTLKLLDDDSVKIGYIDIDKNVRSTMCFIVPDFQSVTEASIEVDEEETSVDVYFFVRKDSKDCLFRQALRYAGALQNYIHDDYSVGNNFVQCTVDKVEYFDNVEDASDTIRATKVTLTVYTEGC